MPIEIVQEDLKTIFPNQRKKTKCYLKHHSVCNTSSYNYFLALSTKKVSSISLLSTETNF